MEISVIQYKKKKKKKNQIDATFICMRLSTQYSTSFKCVRSPECNMGNVYLLQRCYKKTNKQKRQQQ